MELWVSHRLNVIAIPVPNQQPPDLHVNRVGYRKLDEVWLAWLRVNWNRGLCPRSAEVVGERHAPLADLISKYMPDLVGSTTEIPAGYEPPAIDSVIWSQM